MSFLKSDNPDEMVALLAQAVIDKMEEQMRVSNLVDQVAHRVLKMQAEEAALQEQEAAPQVADSATTEKMIEKENTPHAE